MSKQVIATFRDFFSENPNCEQILMALYDLNQLEFEIYCTLVQFEIENQSANVDTLMFYVKRDDRTMINRALLRLLELDLCTRNKVSQKGRRGYSYSYKPTSLSELKDRLLKKITSWYDHAIGEVNEIETRFLERHKEL